MQCVTTEKVTQPKYARKNISMSYRYILTSFVYNGVAYTNF